MYNGILLVDKPREWTSFDVVAKVRGILQGEQRAVHEARGLCYENQLYAERCKCKIKVGHTGTLDPMATGLLVLCIGTYTKKVTTMIKHDKTYEAELTLGAVSTTGDAEGDITTYKDTLVAEQNNATNVVSPTSNDVERVLNKFTGEQMQTPPAFSALKVNGRRAYDLARAGQKVVLEPRSITVHSLEMLAYEWPVLQLRVSVSSGTYIRSLTEDIGVQLGVGAYLSGLRRTVVDTFLLTDAVSVEELSAGTIAARLRSLT
jgi:tRNA pseudouridine55 synthase